MWQPGLRVKFCACVADERLGYPRWELWRPKSEPDQWGVHSVGEIMSPPLEHRLLTDRVLQDLNRPAAFDMDLGWVTSGWKLILEGAENVRKPVSEGRLLAALQRALS